MGMSVDALVRVLLFLAVLGVVSMGFALDPKDPAGSAFLLGAGEVGHKLFGIVFFCAALNLCSRAAYTSVSFLKTLFESSRKNEKINYYGLHLYFYLYFNLYRKTSISIDFGRLCKWFNFACYIGGYALCKHINLKS